MSVPSTNLVMAMLVALISASSSPGQAKYV
jgi:hypothetical protein